MTNDQLREINEAIDAGYRALRSINEAQNHIGSAKGMGLWDMLGGGFFSGMLKHNEMDQAQRCVQQAQYEIERFRRELSDVNMQIQVQINFDGFTKFIDIFCDNFFVDLFVQSKMGEMKRSLDQVEEQIRQVIIRLEAMKQM